MQAERTPLLASCIRQDWLSVNALLQHPKRVNINIDMTDVVSDKYLPLLSLLQDGSTPLLVACRRQNDAVVKKLVSLGADVNKSNKVLCLMTGASLT